MTGPSGRWHEARRLAEQASPTRNRFADFLRAFSIAVVVLGHWLMATPVVDGGGFSLGDMLEVAPWSQWLTWIFQVMPLFFVVGGYANAASWESARRSGGGYRAWVGRRLRRLVAPLVPLLVFWSVAVVLALALGVPPEIVEIGSAVAFIPSWFLAVYILVVTVVPITFAAWRRLGMASFWLLFAAAAAVDAVAFAAGVEWLRWANYAFVWLSVHHLGYLWRDGRSPGPGRPLACAGLGLALLVLLVGLASYPVSMITVPGEEVSNSRPPTLALLALGMLHGGLALALERPARRWLQRPGPWTATVLVNGSIMTLYLWHATVMVIAVGLAYWLGGVGLRLEPASAQWWLARPAWILVLAAGLGAFVAAFGRFEQRAHSTDEVAPPVWRSLVGAVVLCAGIALLARDGLAAGGASGLRVGVLILTFGGALLVVGPALPSPLGKKSP